MACFFDLFSPSAPFSLPFAHLFWHWLIEEQVTPICLVASTSSRCRLPWSALFHYSFYFLLIDKKLALAAWLKSGWSFLGRVSPEWCRPTAFHVDDRSDCPRIHFAKSDLGVQVVTAWTLHGRLCSLPSWTGSGSGKCNRRLYPFLILSFMLTASSHAIFILFYIFPSLLHKFWDLWDTRS